MVLKPVFFLVFKPLIDMTKEKETNSHESDSRPGTKTDICAVCKAPIHIDIVPTPDADIRKWVHSEGSEFDHPAIKKP